MHFYTLSAVLCAFLATGSCYIVDPGPVVKATKGAVWPKPFYQASFEEYFIINPKTFQFNTTRNDCLILQKGLTRYWKIIANSLTSNIKTKTDRLNVHNAAKKLYMETNQGYLETLSVDLLEPCEDKELPTHSMKEEYNLTINANLRELRSDSVWGILRGLETFSQLVYFDDDYLLKINMTLINDKPRFSHRGLLLDTARHYIPMHKIFNTLDAMAYNKFNVFHWHIVDDHSFPYKSKAFPSLSQKGAYHPINKIYDYSDVQNVIEYARLRGIRVMPEFDTPGHTRSWGEGITDILTPCYKGSKPTGQFGPIDPTRDNVYPFLQKLFKEVTEVFPEKYLHLGGDEVGFECWQSNPQIKQFMLAHKMGNNYAALESYYVQKVVDIVKKLGASSIVWEEVFDNGVTIPKDTIVHVWRDNNFTAMLSRVTEDGHPALLSSCWYLDHIETGGDWKKFYDCEPYNFTGTDQQKRLVIGGEACMWSESVNEFNLLPRVWPRASAAAEKLWSSFEGTKVTRKVVKDRIKSDYGDAPNRLEEHTCRMNIRGIPAQPPNGPGFCP